jgi:hypothetical protein
MYYTITKKKFIHLPLPTPPIPHQGISFGNAIVKTYDIMRLHEATVLLNSNQIWKDLREFYSLIGVFENLPKIKKQQS